MCTLVLLHQFKNCIETVFWICSVMFERFPQGICHVVRMLPSTVWCNYIKSSYHYLISLNSANYAIWRGWKMEFTKNFISIGAYACTILEVLSAAKCFIPNSAIYSNLIHWLNWTAFGIGILRKTHSLDINLFEMLD